jgi:hypothetical protein
MLLSAYVIRALLFQTVLVACFYYDAAGQMDTSMRDLAGIATVSNKTLEDLQKRYVGLESKIHKHSVKVLIGMEKTETDLKRKIQLIDTTKAAEIFTADAQHQYTRLRTKTNVAGELNNFPLKEYLPGLDSVQTSLSFLLQSKGLPLDKLQQLHSLSTELKNSAIGVTTCQRGRDLPEGTRISAERCIINSGAGKQLSNINHRLYYYEQQIAEYKALVSDKQKLKEKILTTIRDLPAFQSFWKKYSYLAVLFPTPADYGTPQALTGLQTRASVQSLIAQRIGAGSGTSADPQQYFQEQVNAAQSQLNQLKEKLNKLGTNSGANDMTIPDFKPNEQKTKTFAQRLEYGFNLQTAPAYYALPATTDFALTLGYKVSDTKKFGFGASYKLGLGSIQNIQLSSQGVGLRSYVDVKAKGSLWLSGGFEYNYMSAFNSLQDLQNNIDVWQRSALAGLSKQYRIGKKREGSIQLLYDFLHNQQNPPSQALKFRVGYTF